MTKQQFYTERETNRDLQKFETYEQYRKKRNSDIICNIFGYILIYGILFIVGGILAYLLWEFIFILFVAIGLITLVVTFQL